jgi:hypothetical protein
MTIDPQHQITYMGKNTMYAPVSRSRRREEVQPPPSRRSTHTGGSSDLAQQ